MPTRTGVTSRERCAAWIKTPSLSGAGTIRRAVADLRSAGEGKRDPSKAADPFADDKSPVARYRPVAKHVTAAMFLLMRTEDITSEVFVCPTTLLRKWDFEGGANTSQNWTNWPGNDALAKHLSYSLQNPYLSVSAITSGFKWNNLLPAEFAVAADMNPGGDAISSLIIADFFPRRPA